MCIRDRAGAVDFLSEVCLPFLTNWLNVGIPFTSCDIVCWLLCLSAKCAHKNIMHWCALVHYIQIRVGCQDVKCKSLAGNFLTAKVYYVIIIEIIKQF